jgi:hypothetical protein
MKILKIKDEPKTGKRIATVELDRNEDLFALTQGAMYQLGEPLYDMVVHSHIIEDIKPVSWCPVSQKWVE